MGREAVGRLNRLGAVIDVSQLTKAGTLQAVQLSRAPVVATHSGAAGILDNARNLTDQLLPDATVADLVSSIDYAAKRVGADHIGISSDFNPGGGVTGWRNEGGALSVTVSW